MEIRQLMAISISGNKKFKLIPMKIPMSYECLIIEIRSYLDGTSSSKSQHEANSPVQKVKSPEEDSV